MSKDIANRERLANDLDKIYGELVCLIDDDLQHNELSYEDFYTLMKVIKQIGTIARKVKGKIYKSKL